MEDTKMTRIIKDFEYYKPTLPEPVKAHIELLQQEITRLRAGLKFYAHKENWVCLTTTLPDGTIQEPPSLDFPTESYSLYKDVEGKLQLEAGGITNFKLPLAIEDNGQKARDLLEGK